MSESRFIDKSNWIEIERGYFFQAAMYYLSDTEQPLRFLETDESGVLSISERNGDFNPVEIDGRLRAVEQDIIITVKPRQVIILSDDKLNQSPKFEYVQVIPILGLNYAQSQTTWYQDLINDKHLGFAYIAQGRFGVEADLTQVTTIHKSMLLQKQRPVPVDRMAFIESHLLELLDL